QVRSLGDGLSACGDSVSTARRSEADASDVDTGASVSRRRLREIRGRKERTRGNKVKPVERNEIIDYVTYEEKRDAFRDKVMQAKAPRRVHIGEYLTLLFENHLTMQYQIQEMVRTERMVKESDIQHEIETYNEVLGGDGEFGCTLMIEIDDPAVRDVKLKEWWALPEKMYLLLE